MIERKSTRGRPPGHHRPGKGGDTPVAARAVLVGLLFAVPNFIVLLIYVLFVWPGWIG